MSCLKVRLNQVSKPFCIALRLKNCIRFASVRWWSLLWSLSTGRGFQAQQRHWGVVEMPAWYSGLPNGLCQHRNGWLRWIKRMRDKREISRACCVAGIYASPFSGWNDSRTFCLGFVKKYIFTYLCFGLLYLVFDSYVQRLGLLVGQSWWFSVGVFTAWRISSSL